MIGDSSLPSAAHAAAPDRIAAVGKFLVADGRRFLVKGVTYGTFAPDLHGQQFPSPDRIAEDFALMIQHGVNTVRTYTVPPVGLLDEAARHGLRVMAGVPWAQHLAFLDDKKMARDIRRSTTERVRALARHPATMLIAIGNEIPPAIVRWHTRPRIEQFLRELYDDAKSAAPDSLLTYVNFPPTEYLSLPFLDVVSFNIFLHREPELRAYLIRLQNAVGNKPLLMAELGADSIRQGAAGQADLTSMQLRVALREGVCGAIAFAWTDEWWRGGYTVEDWAFGLVDADRRPKPALAAVEHVFAEEPFPAEVRQAWPKVSVIICACNAADTIDDCLASLAALTYPNRQVIVVNDGSRDATGEIARRYPGVEVIDIPNGGLSAARNVGLGAATGDIVAYTDADVRVDPDWLTYLVQPFLRSDVVGSGGPNVVPPDDPWMAQCVARAPGAPTHVLHDDWTAEHVPGCNMAFRRDVLLSVGGFNPIFLRAGDDVDLCWRLLARGWKIGFAPAALVWHHHRASVRTYWRQQVGYGEGERWLVPHHPDRFRKGRPVWHGHIYSPLPFVRALARELVNTGPWGTAAFPSVYRLDRYPFAFMPLNVGWQLASVALLLAGAVMTSVHPGTVGAILIIAGLAGLSMTFVRCALFAIRSDISGIAPLSGRPLLSRALFRLIIGGLHWVQPIARAAGWLRGIRAANGHVPAESRGANGHPTAREVLHAAQLVAGRRLDRLFWGEGWTTTDGFLKNVHEALRASSSAGTLEVDDGWQAHRDISARVGHWGWLDLRAVVEDHGSGRGLARIELRPRLTPSGRSVFTAALLAGAAALLVWPLGAGSVMTLGALGATLAGVSLVGSTWRMARTLRAVDHAVRRAAAACKMQPMPAQAAEPVRGTRRPATVRVDVP